MKKIIGKTLSIIVLLSLIFAGGSFGYINGYDNGIKNMNAALAWEIDRTYDCMQKLNAIDVDIEINNHSCSQYFTFDDTGKSNGKITICEEKE